jgi:hypothetical protein
MLEALIVMAALGAVGSGAYFYQKGKKPKVPKAVKKVKAIIVP